MALQERGKRGLSSVCRSALKYWDKRHCGSTKGLCLSIEHNPGQLAPVPARGGGQSTGLGTGSRRGLSPCHWESELTLGGGDAAGFF